MKRLGAIIAGLSLATALSGQELDAIEMPLEQTLFPDKHNSSHYIRREYWDQDFDGVFEQIDETEYKGKQIIRKSALTGEDYEEWTYSSNFEYGIDTIRYTYFIGGKLFEKKKTLANMFNTAALDEKGKFFNALINNLKYAKYDSKSKAVEDILNMECRALTYEKLNDTFSYMQLQSPQQIITVIGVFDDHYPDFAIDGGQDGTLLYDEDNRFEYATNMRLSNIEDLIQINPNHAKALGSISKSQ